MIIGPVSVACDFAEEIRESKSCSAEYCHDEIENGIEGAAAREHPEAAVFLLG